MAQFIYQMQRVRKTHNDRLILDDVTLAFYPGAKIGVVGPNGAGKTTLLELVTGQVRPDGGELHIGPTVRLAYADQARWGWTGA